MLEKTTKSKGNNEAELSGVLALSPSSASEG